MIVICEGFWYLKYGHFCNFKGQRVSSCMILTFFIENNKEPCELLT